MSRSLKEKSLASSVKILVNDIEDLREAWGTLDTCFDRPEKCIAEALEPVTKLKGYKAFDSSAVRELYSLLRAATMGARKAGILHRLINDQTLPCILAQMPANDWRQWAKERPLWIGGVIEEAFWTFVDQKWRDALNVAAAEPTGWTTGSSGSRTQGADKKGPAEAAKRLSQAAIHVTAVEEKPSQAGGGGKRCMFADVLGCPRQHAPWRCGAFGSIQAEERAKIIEDNQLCAYCLLHDRAEACRTKDNKSKPACGVPECEGRHAIWLHELLKDIYGKEGQVHVLQGETGWRTPEETWMEDEREEEEEVMFVNMVRQEEEELEEETTTSDEKMQEEIKEAQAAVDECYRRRAERAGIEIKAPKDRLLTEEELDNLSEQLGDGVGAQAKRRKEIERISITEMEAEAEEVRGGNQEEKGEKGKPIVTDADAPLPHGSNSRRIHRLRLFQQEQHCGILLPAGA